MVRKRTSIKLTSASNDPNPVHVENIITTTKGSSGTDTDSLFGLGYDMGDDCDGGGYCVADIIPNSQYNVSIWYNGAKVFIKGFTAP